MSSRVPAPRVRLRDAQAACAQAGAICRLVRDQTTGETARVALDAAAAALSLARERIETALAMGHWPQQEGNNET